MAIPRVRQLAGDIRLWLKNDDTTLTPVIPEASDPDKNQPIESNAAIFSYEAGEEVNVVSKRRGSRYNQPIHNETQPGTTSISITLLEIPPLILARALYGEAAISSVAAGSATDAAFSAVNIGVPIQLPHRMIKASPAIVVEKAGTPLVLNTDYTISADNLRRGQIMPVAGGAIAKGDALTATYEYDAYDQVAIEGGAVPTKSFYVTGDMEDRNSEADGELRVPEARLTVDGEVDWLSSEPLQVTLAGPCIVADGEDAPYTFVEYEATA